MLDEALREFRRVADLRPTDASAPFYLGLIALRQARWDEAAAGVPAGGRRGGAPSPRRCTTWGTRSSGSAGWTRPRRPTAMPPARARDDARIMLGWSIVALKRGEHQVAQGRLARARELLGGKPAPALWYWAATLASAGLDDGAGALRAARGRRGGVSRRVPCCRTISPCCSS